MLKSISLLIICLVLALGFWHLFSQLDTVESQSVPSNFKGALLAASDADMLATAYADGILNKVAGIEDSLSYIHPNGTVISQSHISNSVVSWPSIIAWHAQSRFAYVAETKGIHRSTEQQLKDVWQGLPEGELISVVDYSKPHEPVLVQQVKAGKNIQGVSVNHDGTLLAAGSTEQGKEIVLMRLENGLIKDSHHFTEADIEAVANNNSGIRTMEFHPNQNIIAANLNNKSVVFYQVEEQGNGLALKKIGESLEVAKHWSVGNWHPSGKYFILSDVAWGKGDLGAILNGKGKLVSVGFDAHGEHRIISKTKVGLSPEGFDLSPDGNYAIVCNMRRTYGPKKFWFVPARKGASLSLVKVNQATGELSTIGKQYGFEGALPEDAVFDQESNSIAVAVFHEQDEVFPEQGWIDYWELTNDQLIRTEKRSYVTRGVHNLLLIPHQN